MQSKSVFGIASRSLGRRATAGESPFLGRLPCPLSLRVRAGFSETAKREGPVKTPPSFTFKKSTMVSNLSLGGHLPLAGHSRVPASNFPHWMEQVGVGIGLLVVSLPRPNQGPNPNLPLFLLRNRSYQNLLYATCPGWKRKIHVYPFQI